MIIIDSYGNLVYSSEKDDSSLPFFLFYEKENCDRILCGRSIFMCKKIFLSGESYFVFLNTTEISDKHKKMLSPDKNKILNVNFTDKKYYSLRELASLFEVKYLKKAEECGFDVRFKGKIPQSLVFINAENFALAMAITAHIAAQHSSHVTFNAINECGRITIFADAAGDTTISDTSQIFLRMLLYEISAEAGFSINEKFHGGKRSIEIELNPLDVAMLGLKVHSLEAIEEIFDFYLKIF